MQFNDRTMTIATGLILAFSVGGIVHFSDHLLATAAAPDPSLAVSQNLVETPTLVAELQPELQEPESGLFSLVSAAQAGTQPRLTVIEIETPAVSSLSCDIQITTQVLEHGHIDITATAPCQSNQVATISHAGLSYSLRADDDGTIRSELPALTSPASIQVTFSDQAPQLHTLDIANMDGVIRSGIGWQGNEAVELHALEFGAIEGGAGHVWPDAANTAQAAGYNGSGYLISLGDASLDAPKRVQIYTLPNHTHQADGTIDLSVRLLETAESCGDTLRISFTEHNIYSTQSLHSVNRTSSCTVGDITTLSTITQDLRVTSK